MIKSCGSCCDVLVAQRYRHASSRMIWTMLYCRRFFLYFSILGGIEEDGTGAVYSFDPVEFNTALLG
ncbi:hypothetical protein V8B97DRAFT_1874665 [Scleroderma yunnanense]